MNTFHVLFALTSVFAVSLANVVEKDEASFLKELTSNEVEEDFNKFGQCLSTEKYRAMRIVDGLLDILCFTKYKDLKFDDYYRYYRRGYYGSYYLRELYNDAKDYKINLILSQLYKFSKRLLAEKLDDNLYKRLGLPELFKRSRSKLGKWK